MGSEAASWPRMRSSARLTQNPLALEELLGRTSGSASARRAAAPLAIAVRLVARGDGGYRQLELPLRALREIHSKPVRNAAGQRRNDDLVELLAGQRILDGGER